MRTVMVAQTLKRTKKGARLCFTYADEKRVVHHSHHQIVMSQCGTINYFERSAPFRN